MGAFKDGPKTRDPRIAIFEPHSERHKSLFDKEKAVQLPRRTASCTVRSGRQDLNLRPLDPQSSTLNQAELRPDRIQFRHDADASAGGRWAVVCFSDRAISGGCAIISHCRSAPQRRNARDVVEDVARTAKTTPGKRSKASAPAAPPRSTQTKLPSRSFLRSDVARRRTLRPAASTTCIRLPHRQTRHKRRRPLAEPVGDLGSPGVGQADSAAFPAVYRTI